MTTRDYDLVLYGATGFVGRLTAGHLARRTDAGVRIALAGRSRERLSALRDELGRTDWGVLVADSHDVASLQALAAATRVVVTTVGPYASSGLALVGACAAAGTHYVDLTGEVLFVRDSIDAFDGAARASGARIVHGGGADSVPSDLATLVTAQAVAAAGDGELGEVDALWRDLRGGVSGGTLASMGHQIELMGADPTRARLARDPYALSPDRDAEPQGRGVRGGGRPGRARRFPGWETPYLLAGYNGQIVRRSNALAGYAYGRSLRYREALSTGASLAAPLYAWAAALGQGALAAGFTKPAGRALLTRLLPAPGEGPSEKARRRGRFVLELRATTTTGARWITRFGAAVDPGYDGTAIMLGEAGLALAFDDLPAAAGVLTPATGIGAPLVDRLRSQGFTIDARRV